MTGRVGMTVCSGIGAPELSAPWIDWRFQSEVEPFACAVLAERFPKAVNLGDMRKFGEWPDARLFVLCGGTPCQSFSVAGLRAGLADPRGNLSLVYLAIAARYRPEWLVWENVPGVLSSNRGRDFGAFLGALAQLGYGFAWRVLDAQYVRTSRFRRAVPQRRRRLFLVGCSRGWAGAAAALLEPEGMQGHAPPRREAGQAAHGVIGGGPDGGRVSGAVIAKWAKGSGGPAGDEAYNLVAFDALAGGKAGHAVGEVAGALHGGGRHGGRAVVAFSCKDGGGDAGEVAPTLRGMGHGRSWANGGGQVAVAQPGMVRRLTPRECERLQGLPDDWTRIAWRGKPAARCPDGRRYRAIGNSWAVNCGEFVFDRIRAVDAMMRLEGLA